MIALDPADDATVARWLAARLNVAVASQGQAALCAPGGSTPGPILALLGQDVALDWSRITVWPGDEREVPVSDPASNLGALQRALGGTAADIQALTVHSAPPRFTVTWVGMGDDGHVASLFPSSDPQPDDPSLVRRIVPDPLPEGAPFPRLSLTIPALLACDVLLVVTRGANKRALLNAAATGKNDLPVARLLAAARATRRPVQCFT